MEKQFNGVNVFSATMREDREFLGEKVTRWLADHPTYECGEMLVTQSSDSGFHCIAITVFYCDPAYVARRLPPVKKAS